MELFWPGAVVFLVAVGVFAGLLAGLLGVGGGIVVVPALYFGFAAIGIDPEVRMHLAVGTSLATIIPTGLRSALTHHRFGAVDTRLLRAWGLPVLVGVVVGAVLASRAPDRLLVGLFGVVALGVALHMLISRADWRLSDRLPPRPFGEVLASLVGTLSTMVGIGGGTFMVPLLNLSSFPIHRAVGTAAAFGVIIAVPGALGFALAGAGSTALPDYSVGYVYVPGFVLLAPSAMLAAPWGARLAHRLSATRLRQVFAVFLGLTAVRLLSEL